MMVSIHAPAREATVCAAPLTTGGAGFNPRPRAGGDESPGQRFRGFGVSIHAPAREGDARRMP